MGQYISISASFHELTVAVGENGGVPPPLRSGTIRCRSGHGVIWTTKPKASLRSALGYILASLQADRPGLPLGWLRFARQRWIWGRTSRSALPFTGRRGSLYWYISCCLGCDGWL